MKRSGTASIGTLLAFAVLVTAAFAQVHPIQPGRPVTPSPGRSPVGVSSPISIGSPIAMPSLRPIALPSNALRSRYVHVVQPGTRVPLSRLPHIPAKVVFNTVTPRDTAHRRRFRPMAATGATIDLTAAATCGTNGALYNVGCTLTWQSVSNQSVPQWKTGDVFQNYIWQPNALAVVACTVALCNSAATYTGATGPSDQSGLTETGTYMFGVYDTTQQVWVSVVYVNAGATASIQVFQDAFHTEQAYQFDVSSSTAAYIYMTNLASSDKYVVYVNSTSVNTYCVYIAPGPASPSPRPPSPMPSGSATSLLCNPSSSAGIQAPDETLALTWPLSTSLQAGTYSVVLYDLTQQQQMGQVQVSLTGSSGNSLLLQPNKVDANPSPAAPSTPADTKFAWDGTTDQSDGGIVASDSKLTAGGAYRWTVTDPQGQMVGQASSASVGVTSTASFTFGSLSPAINAPGLYPSNIWTMQLYEPSTQSVIASQAFQMVGYATQTEFNTNGTLSSSLNFVCDGCGEGTAVFDESAELVFTNTSNQVFPGAGDNISQIEFTTGPATSLTGGSFKPPANTGGNGIAMTFTNNENCDSAAGCSKTVTDTAGNSWTATIYCSMQNPANDTGTSPLTTGGQCVLALVPAAGVVLAPGDSIAVTGSDTNSGLYWYAQGGDTDWPCFNDECSTVTTELPADGITWSSTTANAPSYTPVYFGSTNQELSATASMAITGSLTCGTWSTCGTSNTNRDVTAPYAGTHYYDLNFTQADYQNSTPFSVPSTREDILAFTIKNTSGDDQTATEVAIGFPSYFTASEATLDSQSTAGNDEWRLITCPTNMGPQFICMEAAGANGGITQNSTQTIYIDTPMTVSSFGYGASQSFQVQLYLIGNWNGATTTGTTKATVLGGGGAGTNYNSLNFGAYSLNGYLMSALFQPSSVGEVTTGNLPLTLVVNEYVTSVESNPDPIDLIVIEQATSNAWKISGTPTYASTGPTTDWVNLSATGYNVTGNYMEYWFGLCTGQYTNHTRYTGGASPPQSPPNPTNLTAPATYQVTGCGTPEEFSLAAGQALTINLNMSGMTNLTGTETFYMYAHGANGGGWSQPQTMTLTITNESANAGFTTINGTAVGTNNVPTIGTSPNTYVYAFTNTSATQNISSVAITIPAWDINGAAATDGTNYWDVTGTPTLSGNGDTGCKVAAFGSNPASNSIEPTPGSANGQIVTGCTNFAKNDVLDVTFTSDSPEVESDTYLFPSTVDGVSTAATWLGDQQVDVQFTIGLALTVDPSNPGPGGSTPNVSCSQCTFSGETIDYGSIANESTVTGTDVAKASVIYEGSTSANTWNLTVSTSSNPTCTSVAGFTCAGGTPLSELLVELDSANSSNSSSNRTKCGTVGGITYSNNTAFVALTSTGVALATGPETKCTEPYELINDFEVQVGSEAVTGHVQTITYTLIAN